MTKSKFQQLKTTKVGDIGELIIRKHLNSYGFDVYGQVFDCSYPVDGYASKSNNDGFRVFAWEAKCYARLFSRPANGIDRRDFYTYRDLSNSIELVLFFLDPFEQAIYSMDFAAYHETGSHEGNKVFFDLEFMKFNRMLTKAELRQINWRFDPHYRNVQKFFL